MATAFTRAKTFLPGSIANSTCERRVILAQSAASVSGARTRRTLALEIDGPENEVEQFLAVVDGKAISVGSIQLRVKKLDFD